MLLGIAVGDAKGITYENLTYEEVQSRLSHSDPFYLGTDNKHAFIKNYPPGKWTDSTQLSLAMAKALSKAPHFHMLTIVDEHVKAFKYRTDGWGFTNRQSIERLANGTHSFLNSGNKETTGNGAVMKLCPLAMYYACKDIEKDEMIRQVALLTSMTHDSPVCIIASCLFVLFAEHIYRDALTNSVSMLFSLESRKQLAIKTLEWAKELEAQFLPKEQSTEKIHTKVSPYIEAILRNFESLADPGILIKVSNGGSLFVLDVLSMAIGIILGYEPSFNSILTAATIGGDCNITGAMVGGVIGGILNIDCFQNKVLEPLENTFELISIASTLTQSLK